MRRVLFIDRDGTLIIEPPDEQVDSLEKLDYYPGVFTWLGKIAREGSFSLVMVTNQDGLGTERFPEAHFRPVHERMMRTLAAEGITFDDVHIDRSLPEQNLPTRKPGTGMLTAYFTGDYDLPGSFVIGDRLTDVELAKNLGARAILLNDGSLRDILVERGLDEYCVLVTPSWQDIYEYLMLPPRKAHVRRTTRETDIDVTVGLDGTGTSSISTGIGFFDHMLEQLARHGGIDLNIAVKGDLHIDEHHTIEDTALALGEAFATALGDKRGLARYGFCLPMDDCLAQVAVDFGGRPWLVWDAVFTREKIGEMPTEMFFHFFKSFADASKANLNVKAEGTNEHHKIEAIFKAFAKAIKMAVKREPGSRELPTTKGML
ncbi:MAG TPA: bifunctional histidinol-phosphatase/imidazoleglycerol-phosphate dehydratase HisB [Cyclobacteriaceae bacterium]